MNQRSILIVEDDLEIRNMLTWILGSEGYRTATAENGSRGLAMLEDLRPDLVILDGHMPVLDGIGFANQLRQRGLDFPILAMTASRGSTWPKDIGAIASIAKPFDLDELLALVASLLASDPTPATSPPEVG
jgi:two-component system, chemotaxis family, chemotaxis protein CheY